MYKFISLYFALMTSFLALAQDKTVTSYFSPVEGWNETSREIYLGEDLFFLINGGAEVYLEYGFEEVLSVDLQNETGAGASVEIYKMENKTSAYGIWSFNAKQGKSPKIGEHSFQGNDYLMFQKGDAYVIVRSEEAEDMNPMIQLAESIASNIPEREISEEWYRPLVNYDSYRTVLVDGNVALNNFYYFGYENVFNISRAVVLENEETKHLVIRYENEADRRKAMEQALKYMEKSSKFKKLAAEQGYIDRKENTIRLEPYAEYLLIGISKEDINNQTGKIIRRLGGTE